jgi:hypothetical protein
MHIAEPLLAVGLQRVGKFFARMLAQPATLCSLSLWRRGKLRRRQDENKYQSKRPVFHLHDFLS